MKISLKERRMSFGRFGLIGCAALATILVVAATRPAAAQPSCTSDCQVDYAEENAACGADYGFCRLNCSSEFQDCTNLCNSNDSACLSACRDWNTTCTDICTDDEVFCAAEAGYYYGCCLDYCNGGNLCP